MKNKSDTWAKLKGYLVAECLYSRAMQCDDAAGDGVCRLFAVFNTVLAQIAPSVERRQTPDHRGKKEGNRVSSRRSMTGGTGREEESGREKRKTKDQRRGR